MRLPTYRGRGSQSNPANRFLHRTVEYEPGEEFRGVEDEDVVTEVDPRRCPTEYLVDTTASVIAANQSPDVPFDFSLNPYRGCEHGCIYCYARPTHEFLGFSAGVDFERKILVKHRAPELLRSALSRPGWKGRLLGLSGVTDPYQPVERRLQITRKCLEVLRDFRNPVTIVTKNHLVTRDVDLLQELAQHKAVRVTLSITSLRPSLQRLMEPRTSSPTNRLRAIETLAEKGIPVGVNIAPVIPGLTDDEMPAILKAAASAGASHAAYLMVRLPLGVADLFEEWLATHFPDRKARVMARIRDMRGGVRNDATFHRRDKGTGTYARHLGRLFRVSARRVGLGQRPEPLSTSGFRQDGGHQGDLFA